MSASLSFDLLKETFENWSKHKTSRLAAALAYYTVFSLQPLLIMVIAIAGSVLGEEAAKGQIFSQLHDLIGQEGAKAIEMIIVGAANSGMTFSLSTSLISLGILIFGATAVVIQLQDALNTIWEVNPKPGHMIKTFLFRRLLSFSMIMGVVFMLMVSLVLSATLGIFNDYLGELIPGMEFILPILDMVISLAVISLLFAMMFKYLPDVKIAWKDVMMGAVLTALLFNLGKYLIGLYIAESTFSSAYGAAGSLVVLLAWIYYSAQILFLGAEFTQVYTRHYGSGVQLEDYAEYVTEEAKAQQGMVSP